MKEQRKGIHGREHFRERVTDSIHEDPTLTVDAPTPRVLNLDTE